MRRIYKYYKKRGLLKTIAHSLHRIGIKICFKKLFLMETQLPLCKDSNTIDGLIVYGMSESELRSVNDYNDGWFDKKGALLNLQRGSRLFVARKSSEICGYLWMDLKAINAPYLDLYFNLPAGTICLSYNHVEDNSRNKGLGTFLAIEGLKRGPGSGAGKAVTFVDCNNIPSLRVKEKIGFKRIAVLTYIRIIFLKFYLCSGIENGLKRFMVLFGLKGDKLLNGYL